MTKWVTRHRGSIILLLLLLTMFLLFGNLLKHKLLSFEILSKNKDAFSSLNSIVNIIVILIGAIFSYYRFFRGRTLFSRAELKIIVAVLPTTQNFNYHSITLEVKNIGTRAIWDPLPEMHVYYYGPDGHSDEEWRNWRELKSERSQKNALTVVDTGESVTYISNHEVPKSIWTVTYVAFVTSDKKEIWKCSTEVSNFIDYKHNQVNSADAKKSASD